MRNSYTQELYTGVKNLWDSLKRTLNYCASLTRPLRSILAGEPQTRIARRRCLVLVGLYCVIGITPARAYDPNVESYKLYAHMKLLDDKSYRCLVVLWRSESQWNPKAKNPKSSAYGIPQLLKMTERNPYKQIDLGLKYIAYRYGNPCKALDHHKKVGHY